MEAEYKVCGITGLWADCCVLFVVRQAPAGKSKVQIYKLKSNKESTAATLKASVLLLFLRFFVCLFGFLCFSHSRCTPLSCSGPLINQSAFSIQRHAVRILEECMGARLWWEKSPQVSLSEQKRVRRLTHLQEHKFRLRCCAEPSLPAFPS